MVGLDSSSKILFLFFALVYYRERVLKVFSPTFRVRLTGDEKL